MEKYQSFITILYLIYLSRISREFSQIMIVTHGE